MPDAAPSTNGTHAAPTITVSEALKTYAQLLSRVTMTRAGITFAGKRDLYETLGYRRDLRYEDYYERYLRGGIAARVIDAFPASTWRMIPIPGSLVSTRSILLAARSVPSATQTWPAWIERPMPTPPPWWMETQVAPEAVLTSALRSAQSAMASEPSFIPSVSR